DLHTDLVRVLRVRHRRPRWPAGWANASAPAHHGRTTYDDSGRAVEYGTHAYRASWHSFELALVDRRPAPPGRAAPTPDPATSVRCHRQERIRYRAARLDGRAGRGRPGGPATPTPQGGRGRSACGHPRCGSVPWWPARGQPALFPRRTAAAPLHGRRFEPGRNWCRLPDPAGRGSRYRAVAATRHALLPDPTG